MNDRQAAAQATTDLKFTELTWADFMVKYFRWARALDIPSAVSATDAAQFYGFRCTDVQMVHFHKQGEGEGGWFRLKDGRVFKWDGTRSDPDPAFYTNATAH
ncbi:MAG TPA: hypothetical protein VM120_20920 [Bryobacteraceae bacterium]|nr:hypothetical protein [Bryobacteraceae bacterium]